MDAAAAFSHREEQLLGQLAGAQDIDQAIAACIMALEQTACELAQDEQDEHARQRQQAVMALARRAPQLLRAAAARGELVIADHRREAPVQSRRDRLRRGARAAGGFLLAALAVCELIDGQMVFAVLQLIGGVLLLMPDEQKAGAQTPCEARAVPCVEAQMAVRMLRELCQAADICVSDLALLDQDAGNARLSGTADDAMLDLLTALMEAKASGRDELAMRSLAQAEQYLHRLGVELIPYDAAHAQLFDVLPTMGEARTIRPALVKDGRVLRRGAAALQMERGRSA
ncbi:MAG: hypothetical protein ACI4MM_03710 [Candidatus Ventricola sp.]